MKATIYFIVMMLCLPCLSGAQSLGQDREGFSTIVLPSANLNLDLQNKVASFSYYRDFFPKIDNSYKEFNIDSVYKESYPDKDNFVKGILSRWDTVSTSIKKHKKNNSFLLGVDLKGSATDGLSGLFSEEKVTSSSSIGFMIGKRFLRRKYNEAMAEEIAEEYLKFNTPEELLTQINAELDDLIEAGVMNEGNKRYIYTVIEHAPNISLTNLRKNVKDKIKAIQDMQPEAKRDANLKKTLVVIKQLNSLEQLIQKANATLEQIAISTADGDGMALPSLRVKMRSLKDDFTKALTEDSAKNNIDIKAINIHHALDQEEWETAQDKIKTYLEQFTEQRDAYQNSTADYSDLIDLLKQLEESYTSMEEERDYLSLLNAAYTDKETLIYGRAYFMGSGATLEIDKTATTIDNRFEDISFQGYKLEAGVTRRMDAGIFLGVTGGISYTNNLSEMSSSTYTLQTVDTTIASGKFSSSKEIKALPGPYDRFLRYDINIDFVKLFALSNHSIDMQKNAEKSDIYLSLNPYLRHRMYDNHNSIKPHTVLGLGLFAYNNKDGRLAGGLFVQTEDALGTNADKESTFRKRINFGLVVKYNIAGFKFKD